MSSSRSRSGRRISERTRGLLDRLDRQIIRLMGQRVEKTLALGKNGTLPADELAQLTRVDLGQAEGAGWPAEVRGVVETAVRELLWGTRQLLRPTRVAYLGPKYSYSYLAAVRRFGTAADLVPVGSIAAVFEEVQSGQSDYGLVPLENSTDGRIVDTLQSLIQTRARLCGEIVLPIHHYLLGRGERGAVREVHSKPQALSQCRQWLARHLPAARLVETPSTAAAAEAAAGNPSVAAIASMQAAVHYGLDILAANIEDNPNNVTRFAVVGREIPQPTGDDKTALMFELRHRPGALADATAVFKRHRLNMTWIESFPMPGAPQEYLFFVEVEGHPEEESVQKALKALTRKTVRLTILGAYARDAMYPAASAPPA